MRKVIGPTAAALIATAFLPAAGKAHTTELCFVVEVNGSTTVYAGTYHSISEPIGGVIIDTNNTFLFTSIVTSPPVDAECPCLDGRSLFWQVVNVGVQTAEKHTFGFTTVSQIESPLGCTVSVPLCGDGDNDLDKRCNTEDLDDDNDGVADTVDPAPLDPKLCQDSDNDTCDDCAVGTDGFGALSDVLPGNDGPDEDGDGVCTASDGCPTDSLKSAPGVCGCGTVDAATDADLDTVPDCIDVCLGDDATGDADDDGLCTDRDHRPRVNTTSFEGAQGPCTEGGVFVEVGIDEDGSMTLSLSEVASTAYVCNGVTGIDGLRALADSHEIEPGEVCPTGGVKLTLGLDSDRSGDITPDDEVSSYALCSGLHSAIAITVIEVGSEVCPNGGRLVRAGLDEDNSGVLEADEGDVGQTLCNGLNSLVETTTLAPSEECPLGGVSVAAGADENGNGQLDGDEITTSQSVCHGLNSLIAITTLARDPLVCAAGGVRLQAGIDANGNGVLNTNEASVTENVCHGSGSLTKLTPLAPDPAVCPAGGTKVDVGTDTDGDLTLDDTEILSSRNLCSGLSSLTRTTTLAPSATECAFGGTRIDTGVDADGDGKLSDVEVDSTQTLCSGTGVAIRTTAISTGSVECPVGGHRMESGADLNGSGVLDDTEVQNTDILCNTALALFDTETLADGDQACAHGGVRIHMGHDDGEPGGTAGDTVLQTEEIETSREVCLAATDVLINGGGSSCAVSLGRRDQRVSWLFSGLFVLSTVVACRRRRAR